jgi:Flp pilus assembly protein CpaB
VGDRVDVVVNNKVRVKMLSGESGEVISGRTIGQYLEVLAIDRSIEAANAASAQPTPGATGAPGAPPPPPAPPPPGQEKRQRVILAAPPSVAERLVAANQQGTLHVLIRNPSDRPNLPVPEAMEYPVRIVQNPKALERADKIAEENRQEAREIRRQNREDIRARLRASWSTPRGGSGGPSLPPLQIPSPGVGPGPGPSSGNGNPPLPSNEKEVTVVRGTEKTRVIVPSG